MFQHDPEPFAVAPHLYMPSKTPPAGPLYLQQPSLEIIQLVEVPAPPRVRPSSSFMGSSFASSSYSSSTEESDESECSSYCSSDPEEEEAARTSAPDDTYKTRLHRVLVWREKLAHAMGVPATTTPPLSPPPLPLKRKSDDAEDESYDDDMASHSSKRSRSSSYRSSAPRPPSSLSAHSCPACDASFSTRQGLRQHAQSPSSNDACRTAVEYECEA